MNGQFYQKSSLSLRGQSPKQGVIYPARYALFIPTCRDEILRILTEHYYIIVNCQLSNCQISIRFLGIRETTVLHRLNVISHCHAYIARQFSKVAQELRFEARI